MFCDYGHSWVLTGVPGEKRCAKCGEPRPADPCQPGEHDWEADMCRRCWETRYLKGCDCGSYAKSKPEPEDAINPAHYTWLDGLEVIDIAEQLNFCLGNVVKYTLRAEHKGDPVENLMKARWYLDREISRRNRSADG